MPLYIAQSGDLDRCYRCLTDRLTTLKDRATQLLIMYKSGALVTQCNNVSNRLIQALCQTGGQTNKFDYNFVAESDPVQTKTLAC